MSEERSLMPERIKLFQADDMDESADYYHSRLYKAQQSQIAELQQKLEEADKNKENLEWVFVDGYEEIPKGEWLVMEQTINGYEMHVAKIREKVSVIGSYFAFDRGKIYAYAPKPQGPEAK